eukprot:1101312-Rhodomonas_salina.2
MPLHSFARFCRDGIPTVSTRSRADAASASSHRSIVTAQRHASTQHRKCLLRASLMHTASRITFNRTSSRSPDHHRTIIIIIIVIIDINTTNSGTDLHRHSDVLEKHRRARLAHGTDHRDERAARVPIGRAHLGVGAELDGLQREEAGVSNRLLRLLHAGPHLLLRRAAAPGKQRVLRVSET